MLGGPGNDVLDGTQDGWIFAAAAMRPYATITVATCYFYMLRPVMRMTENRNVSNIHKKQKPDSI